jgi:hypothetical protein
MLRQYIFKFKDGQIRKMTEDGAKRYSVDAKNPIIDAWEEGQKQKERKGDKWQKGWQPALGMYITCYGTYKRILKERGLIEVGNEFDAWNTKQEKKTYQLSDDDFRELNQKYDAKIDEGKANMINDI